MVVQKTNIGHLNKIFGYKTLKLLRSYSAFKIQDRSQANICPFEVSRESPSTTRTTVNTKQAIKSTVEKDV